MWRALLQCTSVRFVCFYFLAFYAGLAEAGAAHPSWLVLGAGYWFAHSTATELLNRLADRNADEVNRPERTALCRQVGYGHLLIAARVGYAVLFALGVVWILLVPSPLVIGLLLVANFLSINYSYGLRLSRSRFLSLAVLAFPFVGSFAGGWALGHPRLDSVGPGERAQVIAILVVGGLALASLSGVKDLTDIAGDRLKGYRSGWLWLVRGRPGAVGVVVASLPFATLIGYVAWGVLPARFLALLVLWPAALLLANGSRIAGNQIQLMAVRESFYNYWIVFLALLTILHVGTIMAAVTAVANVVCWRLATIYLHWSDDTSLSWLGVVLRLHRGHRIRATSADSTRTAIPTIAVAAEAPTKTPRH